MNLNTPRWGERPPMETCHVIRANGTFHNAGTSKLLLPPKPITVRALEFGASVCAVHYRQGNANRVQRVALEWTPTPFNGKRKWFVCECGRRAFQLYLPPHYYYRVERFLCARCHEITYRIRNSDYHLESYWHRAERFAERHFVLVGETWSKKPHASYRSFEEHLAKYDALMQRANDA